MSSKSNSVKQMVLGLYKALLRESRSFPTYNFRTYAIRRTRDAFRENKGLTDQNEISKQLETARRNLEVLKRQKTVANLYRTHELIIEKVT